MDAGMMLGMVGAVMGMAGGGNYGGGYAPRYPAYDGYGQVRRYDDPSYGYRRYAPRPRDFGYDRQDYGRYAPRPRNYSTYGSYGY